MITPVTIGDTAIFSDITRVIKSSGVSMSTHTGTLTLLSNGDSLSGSPSVLGIAYHITKVGKVVTFVIKRVSATLTAIRYYQTSAAAIPVEFRPEFEASAPFLPLTGTGTYDSDIMGIIKIQTIGTVGLFREANLGTGTWDGPNQGFDTTSISYFTA